MKNNLISSSILLLTMFCLCACGNNNSNKTKQNVEPVITELKTVFINGDSISYKDIGKGVPVVFVHGTVGDYRAWESQMDTFAISHRIIAYSRRYAYPNNQVVNDSADYSVTAHANDLAQFLKTMDIGPVHLVGHSYGASTALITALKHPELLRSLTLGEPPIMSLLQNIPEGDKLLNEFAANVLMPTAEAFKNNNAKEAVELFVGGVLGDSLYFSQAPQQQRDIMLDNIPELRAVVSKENIFPPLDCEYLKTLKIPVLLLRGEKSPKVLTTMVDELASCLENDELVILPNASHGLQFENPEGFNKTVLKFINKH